MNQACGIDEENTRSTNDAQPQTLGELNLLNADDYEIEIANCRSGHQVSINKQNQNLKLYIGDLNCVAKLKSFSYQGNQYTVSIDFPTTAVGSAAEFSAGSGHKVRVVITSQLSNPVMASDTIGFSLSELNNGAQADLSLIKVLNSGSSGNNAPQLSLKKSSLVGYVAADNAFTFEFELECSEDISNAANNNAACNGQSLAQFSYVLIEDQFGNNGPCQANNAKKCDKFFDGSESRVALPTDLISPNSSAHGGFKTKTLASQSQYYLNSSSWLIISNGLGSYTYFHVSLQDGAATNGNGGGGKGNGNGKGPNK